MELTAGISIKNNVSQLNSAYPGEEVEIDARALIAKGIDVIVCRKKTTGKKKKKRQVKNYKHIKIGRDKKV